MPLGHRVYNANLCVDDKFDEFAISFFFFFLSKYLRLIDPGSGIQPDNDYIDSKRSFVRDFRVLIYSSHMIFLLPSQYLG